MGTGIPVEVEDVTPAWLSEALGVEVRNVDVLDRHSGTTGRALIAVEYATDTSLPPSLFVKLPPFDERQREFVAAGGLGVAEARFYRDLAHEITLRIPAVHYAEIDDDGRFVMVIEDLAAAGCRFPRPGDDDVAAWGGDLVEDLARLHAPFWDSPRLQDGGDLTWVMHGHRTGRNVPRRAEGSGGGFIGMALEQFGDELGPTFRRLAELYIEHAPEIMERVLDEGTPTLIHGDPHLGNLFLDGDTVGFLDWAMLDRRTGMRDVSYVLCNSIPAEIRRAHEHEWIARYRAVLADGGVALDADTAWEQYRLYATYSWVSATSTAAVGSRWQAAKVGQGGMRRATASIEDLDTVGILEDRLGV